MTDAVVVHHEDREKLRALTATVNASTAAPSAQQQLAADDLLQGARTHRTLAVITVLGGAAVVAGAVLHAIARRRGRTPTGASITPTFGPGLAALHLHLRW